MSNQFNHAVKVVLKHEGGFVNHKKDPGGATNYGVSLRFLLRNEADIKLAGLDLDKDGDGDIDAEDIAQMTEKDARDVYFKFWWDKYNYKQILDVDLATKIMDMSVNMGAKQAHKLVQRACRACGTVLVDDGILGPKSFKAINKCADGVLLGAIRTEQKHFYLKLIENNPNFMAFKTGWLNRAYS